MAEQVEKEENIIPIIIQLVNSNDIPGVKEVLLNGKGKIEDVDENGMSPLQHACFKGQLEMCKLLLEYGADVNSDFHDHFYSTLHFAALSGNDELVKLMLISGAKTYHTNSLNRTAAQMAAFVGNHHITALINNYIPINSVQYYTKCQGLETEPKLPAELAVPLHDFIMQTNLHPVFLTITLEKCPLLIVPENLSKCCNVISLLCEKEVKSSESANEVLCLKLHYISFILKTLMKEIKKKETRSSEVKTSKNDGLIFQSIIKKWLIQRPSDGFEEYIEYYVRDAIKSFPYVEMPLYMQIVRIVATKPGESWALDYLHGAINGQKVFNDKLLCSTCSSELKEAKKCAQCKITQYCNKICQRLHWNNHKKFCKDLADKVLKECKVTQ